MIRQREQADIERRRARYEFGHWHWRFQNDAVHHTGVARNFFETGEVLLRRWAADGQTELRSPERHAADAGLEPTTRGYNAVIENADAFGCGPHRTNPIVRRVTDYDRPVL